MNSQPRSVRFTLMFLQPRSVAALASVCLFLQALMAQDAPDIRSVEADLVVPACLDASPAAGVRVNQVHPNWKTTDVYHTLYLPTNYRPGQTYPVIVELPGNGGFKNRLGDACNGLPSGCKFGFGISAGKDFIWLCLPFVSGDGKSVAEKWWGDASEYDPSPTVDYLKQTVPWICQNYGGDPQRVILTGFSRGAIACNYIGLHDDQIAGLWSGMIPYSHYDGVRTWPFSTGDQESSVVRLKRIGQRPQLICHETTSGGRGINATRKWIESTAVVGDFTFVETGFRNHNDAWILRPSPARDQLRRWVDELIH